VITGTEEQRREAYQLVQGVQALLPKLLTKLRGSAVRADPAPPRSSTSPLQGGPGPRPGHLPPCSWLHPISCTALWISLIGGARGAGGGQADANKDAVWPVAVTEAISRARQSIETGESARRGEARGGKGPGGG
jgi:hypothetical protein